ncbi:hypothetical protein Pmani_023209 [Petrolisthes manimaculis]|uniref:Uncharacterized protein n=1 Tax=Petrolisthes manimaculis TaxID=1843537 RepID=A0AAE1U3I1_9EUCA|nr:hypothetical protein Pmani_023209 [Petrolisthes manimaculis]
MEYITGILVGKSSVRWRQRRGVSGGQGSVSSEASSGEEDTPLTLPSPPPQQHPSSRRVLTRLEKQNSGEDTTTSTASSSTSSSGTSTPDHHRITRRPYRNNRIKSIAAEDLVTNSSGFSTCSSGSSSTSSTSTSTSSTPEPELPSRPPSRRVAALRRQKLGLHRVTGSKRGSSKCVGARRISPQRWRSESPSDQTSSTPPLPPSPPRHPPPPPPPKSPDPPLHCPPAANNENNKNTGNLDGPATVRSQKRKSSSPNRPGIKTNKSSSPHVTPSPPKSPPKPPDKTRENNSNNSNSNSNNIKEEADGSGATSSSEEPIVVYEKPRPQVAKEQLVNRSPVKVEAKSGVIQVNTAYKEKEKEEHTPEVPCSNPIPKPVPVPKSIPVTVPVSAPIPVPVPVPVPAPVPVPSTREAVPPDTASSSEEVVIVEPESVNTSTEECTRKTVLRCGGQESLPTPLPPPPQQPSRNDSPDRKTGVVGDSECQTRLKSVEVLETRPRTVCKAKVEGDSVECVYVAGQAVSERTSGTQHESQSGTLTSVRKSESENRPSLVVVTGVGVTWCSEAGRGGTSSEVAGVVSGRAVTITATSGPGPAGSARVASPPSVSITAVVRSPAPPDPALPAPLHHDGAPAPAPHQHQQHLQHPTAPPPTRMDHCDGSSDSGVSVTERSVSRSSVLSDDRSSSAEVKPNTPTPAATRTVPVAPLVLDRREPVRVWRDPSLVSQSEHSVRHIHSVQHSSMSQHYPGVPPPLAAPPPGPSPGSHAPSHHGSHGQNPASLGPGLPPGIPYPGHPGAGALHLPPGLQQGALAGLYPTLPHDVWKQLAPVPIGPHAYAGLLSHQEELLHLERAGQDRLRR